jgi:hypothetical protein
MSRTPGAKDKQPRKSPVRKPKRVMLTKTEVDLAAKLGVTPQQLAVEKVKLQRKPRKPRKPRTPKVDWEKLAKQLQQALAAEIKENDGLREYNTQLITQGIKLLGTIEYLESKRGNN